MSKRVIASLMKIPHVQRDRATSDQIRREVELQSAKLSKRATHRQILICEFLNTYRKAHKTRAGRLAPMKVAIGKAIKKFSCSEATVNRAIAFGKFAAKEGFLPGDFKAFFAIHTEMENRINERLSGEEREALKAAPMIFRAKYVGMKQRLAALEAEERERYLLIRGPQIVTSPKDIPELNGA